MELSQTVSDSTLVETLPQPIIELRTQDEPPHQASEQNGPYEVKNLFGESVPTNLFGEIAEKPKARKRRRK